MAKKKNPNSNPKSGGIGFLITALIFSSISGFSFGGIVLGVLVGLGIGKVASIMVPALIPLRTTRKMKNAENVKRKRKPGASRKKKPEKPGKLFRAFL